MSDKTVQARITGRVQGVNYRAWTEEQARERGLRGWVRNCEDGSVEAVFAGPAGTIDEMLQQCRQGPLAARVDSVEARETGAQDGLDGFRVRR